MLAAIGATGPPCRGTLLLALLLLAPGTILFPKLAVAPLFSCRPERLEPLRVSLRINECTETVQSFIRNAMGI